MRIVRDSSGGGTDAEGKIAIHKLKEVTSMPSARGARARLELADRPAQA